MFALIIWQPAHAPFALPCAPDLCRSAQSGRRRPGRRTWLLPRPSWQPTPLSSPTARAAGRWAAGTQGRGTRAAWEQHGAPPPVCMVLCRGLPASNPSPALQLARLQPATAAVPLLSPPYHQPSALCRPAVPPGLPALPLQLGGQSARWILYHHAHLVERCFRTMKPLPGGLGATSHPLTPHAGKRPARRARHADARVGAGHRGRRPRCLVHPASRHAPRESASLA